MSTFWAIFKHVFHFVRHNTTELSEGHVPFGLVPPGMLKMTQYPFAGGAARSQPFLPEVKQL